MGLNRAVMFDARSDNEAASLSAGAGVPSVGLIAALVLEQACRAACMARH